MSAGKIGNGDRLPSAPQGVSVETDSHPRAPNKDERRHVEALERRAEHLRARIRNRSLGPATSYDVAELKALEWALADIARRWAQ